MNDALTVTYSWTFGGPFADAPDQAWTLLLVAGGFGAVFAWVSYRTAVSKLGVVPSALLVLLRTILLFALLACLANPVRIERRTEKPPEPPPPPPPPRLAIVVDRSDSMTTADNRGRTRLDDALVNWRRLEKTAQTYFAPASYYSFAKDLRPAASLEEAAARTGETSETRLYHSVATLLNSPASERPGAIVVLTDGIDTTSDSAAELRENAITTGVPIYFVSGNNHSARPDPFLRVREWRAPGTVLQNAQFTIEATFEAFSRADRSVRFSLWQGNRRVETGTLALTTGSNLVPRSFTVPAAEPGLLDFTLRLGESADSPTVARSVTRVLEPREDTVRLMLHQGTLDWGFRYFGDAMRSDPSFVFFSILTPDVGLMLTRGGPRGGPALGRLPDSPKPLESLNCVVLAHPYPKQLSTAQQQALVDFVRNGGSVLIVSPDADAIPQFAGGPLEEILPVVFPDAPAAPIGERPKIRSLFSRGSGDDPKRPLETFSLTEAGKASSIFSRADHAEGGFLLPRFREFIPVSVAKPGAEVLAVHPTSRDPATGKPYILLAVETFGRGRSALLTSDALWRWKLSERSDSRVVETFWQQLLLALSRRKEPETLRFTNAPAQVRSAQTVALLIGGAGGEKRPAVMAKSPTGKLISLEVVATHDPEAPWSATWRPAEAGPWEIAAGVEGAYRAHIFPSVLPEEVVGELTPTAPALEAMRVLAGETGGALLAHEAPAAWRPEAKKEKPPEPVVSERRYLRWNKWIVLWIALGAYALELLLRRIWRLL